MSASVDVEEALRLLRRVPQHLHVVGPATPERIRAAEDALGVAFSPSYRKFLSEFGAGSILGREVYGVVPDLSAAGPPNVVRMNLDRRRVVCDRSAERQPRKAASTTSRLANVRPQRGAFDNPDHVAIVIHNPWRLGVAEGRPKYAGLENDSPKVQ